MPPKNKTRRKRNKKIYFHDYPDFKPNLTPKEIFALGSFGGTYWRPIKSKFFKNTLRNRHKRYPAHWWNKLPDNWLLTPFDKYDKSKDKKFYSNFRTSIILISTCMHWLMYISY